jgi:membrane associated rhomboid family serine protease
MLLPLSDAPNPRSTPFVTYGLIAVNVLVYALVTLPLGNTPVQADDPALGQYLSAIRESLPPGITLQAVLDQISAYDLVVFAHGYKPGAPQVTDLLSSLFLHSGFMHLFGNMLFLWIYGDNVEYRLGRLPFLFWYLATGAAATLVFSLFAHNSMVPLVGASGAISGVLGLYFVWFPHNTVRVFVFLFPFFMNVVAIPARIVLGVYLVLDNLLPFLFTGGTGGGVAYGAHLGGFVTGLIAAWVMSRQEVTAQPADFGKATAVPDSGTAPAIEQAIDRGEMEDAARGYFAADPAGARLLNPEKSLELAYWLADHGYRDASLVAFRRHLRDFPTGPTTARAHLGIGLVQLEQLGQIAPAYQHFLDALDLDPDPETATHARAALARIAALQKYRIEGR